MHGNKSKLIHEKEADLKMINFTFFHTAYSETRESGSTRKQPTYKLSVLIDLIDKNENSFFDAIFPQQKIV